VRRLIGFVRREIGVNVMKPVFASRWGTTNLWSYGGGTTTCCNRGERSSTSFCVPTKRSTISSVSGSSETYDDFGMYTYAVEYKKPENSIIFM